MNAQQPKGGQPDLNTQVRQVANALQKVYGDLLDTSDLAAKYSGRRSRRAAPPGRWPRRPCGSSPVSARRKPQPPSSTGTSTRA
ncbi:hypothetical protein ACFQVA_33175 [Actinomadura keratinilytica]